MIEIIPNWHPIFVHFTIGLLGISALFYLAGVVLKKEHLLQVARWNLWIGALITIGTVLAGWYAYNTVNHDGHSHTAMTNHRNWALPTAAAFILLALWSFIRRTKEPAALFMICLLLATAALGVTGYKGGELVYRHGMGVMFPSPIVNGNIKIEKPPMDRNETTDDHHDDGHNHSH